MEKDFEQPVEAGNGVKSVSSNTPNKLWRATVSLDLLGSLLLLDFCVSLGEEFVCLSVDLETFEVFGFYLVKSTGLFTETTA